ncbi:MAG: hypothetical protein JJ850_05810 [Kordiimonadaceae bacterium]|nr:hypothetical protein [Kordiimonadaceae bacterium]MBO6568161.1 hypothetical protein [Kordiimonadaceae bacterium]MBO6964109.1 hypothetical protein [Kordiimonadaceae bacterium]
MKKLFTLAATCLWLLTPGTHVAAQDTKTFTFNKGQVLDVLYLIRRPDTGAALQEYFKTVGPVAQKLNYTPHGAVRVAGKPPQGNFAPDVVVFGTWPGDFEDRDRVYQQLLAEHPDLQSRRMDIWSSFNMTQYEVSKDITLSMDKAKHYVLTAYWLEDASDLSAFQKRFMETLSATSGTSKMLLTAGRSPFGYAFTPDLMVISEWDNVLDAARFTDASKELNAHGVAHVNQFPVAAP